MRAQGQQPQGSEARALSTVRLLPSLALGAFGSFPHQRGFFSWTWPVFPRTNHPAPLSDCLFAASTEHC